MVKGWKNNPHWRMWKAVVDSDRRRQQMVRARIEHEAAQLRSATENAETLKEQLQRHNELLQETLKADKGKPQ